MKYVKFMLFVFAVMSITTSSVYAQDNSAGLNGKQFRCRITEITPPDVDRMPMVYEEVIAFEGGKITSDFLKKFITDDVPFTASIDERRAIAFTVVEFEASGNGTKGESPVSIAYKGNVVGYVGLNGEILINGNGIQEKYIVETVNP
jgi:hypothetical protein